MKKLALTLIGIFVCIGIQAQINRYEKAAREAVNSQETKAKESRVRNEIKRVIEAKAAEKARESKEEPDRKSKRQDSSARKEEPSSSASEDKCEKGSTCDVESKTNDDMKKKYLNK